MSEQEEHKENPSQPVWYDKGWDGTKGVPQSEQVQETQRELSRSEYNDERENR